MATRNSRVILSKNIKMDSEYRNVLNITESDMVTLMTTNENLVYTDSTYSFLREEKNTIYVGTTYGVCLQANYLAFQNPDYSNKYFFAFIESVEYINDKTTKINYKVDLFTTWRSYFNLKSCFVVREHVTDDTIGSHTVPESLETGDYIVNSQMVDSYNNQFGVVVSVTDPSGGYIYRNMLSYCNYRYIDTNIATNVRNIITEYETGAGLDKIQSMFVIPKWISGANQGVPYEGSSLPQTTSSATQDLGISRISTLNGYTPSNNKLLTYPYCYILGTNGAGSSAIYQQELWDLNTNNEMVFRMYGTISVGASIKGVPINYNGSSVGIDYGLNLGKFPTINFPGDTYINWLTQNAVNIGATFATSVGSLGIGVLTGNPTLMFGGAMGIAGEVAEMYQHSKVPPQIEGNSNGGDINFTSSFNRFTFYKMTIKQEYARIIDNYFKLRGYKVNTVKVPNISHRQNFNFVQIASEDTCVYSNNTNNISIPPKDLNDINELFRKGITIWNNHTNLGDFSVSNNIVN